MESNTDLFLYLRIQGLKLESSPFSENLRTQILGIKKDWISPVLLNVSLRINGCRTQQRMLLGFQQAFLHVVVDVSFYLLIFLRQILSSLDDQIEIQLIQ